MFVSSETGRVSCLIVWQHAIIQPQLLAAGYPRAFENPDAELSFDLVEPKLPDDFTSLQAEEQAAARELYRRRLLFFGYRALNGHFNKQHLAALVDPLLFGRQMLVGRVGRQWAGNLITLKGLIMRAVEYWEHLPDVDNIECSVKFGQKEREEFAQIEDIWLKMTMATEICRQRVCNMTEEGWVRNEDYDEAMKELKILKDEMEQQCEGDEEDMHGLKTGWPFRDRVEFY